MLIELHRRLQKHKGKRVYGYLNKNDKELVNKIVEQIEKIPEINELYELWYEKQEELRRMYSETLVPRVSLSENTDFKSIRNAVIKAAVNICAQQFSSCINHVVDEDNVGVNLSVDASRRITNPVKEALNSGVQHNYIEQQDNSIYMSTTVTSLLNNISKIFQDKFSDNPEHAQKVDIKLRRKIYDKDEMHGIKHG